MCLCVFCILRFLFLYMRNLCVFTQLTQLKRYKYKYNKGLRKIATRLSNRLNSDSIPTQQYGSMVKCGGSVYHEKRDFEFRTTAK